MQSIPHINAHLKFFCVISNWFTYACLSIYRVFISFTSPSLISACSTQCSLLPIGFAFNASNQHDQQHHDVILSPNPQKTSSGKYAYFEPENGAAASRQMRKEETATRVPWEEPLKETVHLALGRNSRVRWVQHACNNLTMLRRRIRSNFFF